jgi:16S rRNA (uracil1498-N3)-methyltransferase
LIRACAEGKEASSRIIIDEDLVLQKPFTVDSAVRVALSRWQPRVAEAFTVTDRGGREFRARVEELTDDSAVLLPFEALPRPSESPVGITLYQALPQRERFELILQKGTELGVQRFVPFVSQHSIDQADYDAKQKKSHRWPHVLLKAAKQCRRAVIPELGETRSLDAAMYEARQADLRLFFYEGESCWSLRDAIGSEKPCRVAIFVGPEGGFAPEEVDDFRTLGFLPVCLGPRILRTETAAIAGTAIIQHAVGDID